MTTKDILTTHWGAIRGNLREHWHSLTDLDIEKVAGNYDVLVSILEERYSFTHEMAELEVKRYLNEFEIQATP